MRIIKYDEVYNIVKESILELACHLDYQMENLLKNAYLNESSTLSKNALAIILENQEISKQTHIPLCQDTGIVVIYFEIGSGVLFESDPNQAINVAVKDAYQEGYLRKSVVDCLTRNNDLTNSPAIIHFQYNHELKDKCIIKIMLKGAGSENQSLLRMLKPTASEDEIIQTVVDCVKSAGGRPCPPLLIGVGIGGNFEKAPLLAKEALFEVFEEEDMLSRKIKEAVNNTNVGVMGYGGVNTCLAIKVKTYPCHIASLPLAVNLQCHAARHKVVVI